MKDLTITEAKKKMDAGELTSEALVTHYLEEIEKRNPELNAYLEVYDDALESARASDTRRAEGKAGVLEGIPIALKDNILVKGKKASAASKILENYTAVYTSTAAERLQEAGAVFLGRTNMDEFAMGSSTENSAYGVTSNPIDPTRVPGGTSGGSAAALAAGMTLGSIGSETGGSVRQPATFCGLVGFKPTYGAVSRYGLIAMCSSFDQISQFGKSVEEAELLFDVTKGQDPMDMTTIPDVIWKKHIRPKPETIADLTIGVPWELVEGEGIDKDVLESFRSTLKLLESEGAKIENVTLPTLPLSLASYYIIMPAEASSNLARLDGVKYGLHIGGESGIDDYFETRGIGFGPEVRRRIVLGTFALSAGYYDSYYGKALQARQLITDEFTEAFKKFDLIATPTTPSPAFKKGEKTSDPLAMYLEDVFTVTASLIGIPAISIPTDWVEREGTKLPLGFQLMGPKMSDSMVFGAAKLIEKIYA